MADYKVELPEDTKNIDFNGGEYSVDDGSGNSVLLKIEPDDIIGAPWDECDGHGVVSDWTRDEPEEGDIVLNRDMSYRRYYRYNESLEIAKRDGWRPRANTDGMTPDQIAELAVQEDAERLRAWCNDEWAYESIFAELRDRDGDVLDTLSIGGIESDSSNSHKAELASELVHEFMTNYPQIKEDQIDRLKSKLENLTNPKSTELEM